MPIEDMTDILLPNLINDHLSVLKALCEQYRVGALYVFGSVLTERFQETSDIDFLVVFEKVPVEAYADNFFNFRDALEGLLQRRVDLVERQTLQNAYFKAIVESTKVLVYERGSSVEMAA